MNDSIILKEVLPTSAAQEFKRAIEARKAER